MSKGGCQRCLAIARWNAGVGAMRHQQFNQFQIAGPTWERKWPSRCRFHERKSPNSSPRIILWLASESTPSLTVSPTCW